VNIVGERGVGTAERKKHQSSGREKRWWVVGWALVNAGTVTCRKKGIVQGRLNCSGSRGKKCPGGGRAIREKRAANGNVFSIGGGIILGLFLAEESQANYGEAGDGANGEKSCGLESSVHLKPWPVRDVARTRTKSAGGKPFEKSGAGAELGAIEVANNVRET